MALPYSRAPEPLATAAARRENPACRAAAGGL